MRTECAENGNSLRSMNVTGVLVVVLHNVKKCFLCTELHTIIQFECGNATEIQIEKEKNYFFQLKKLIYRYVTSREKYFEILQ